MEIFLYIFISCFLISLTSWVGVLSLAVKKDVLERVVLYLVSFSAGALMGGAFVHLLPEASEMMEKESLFGGVLLAFILFYFIEKLLSWRHCHKEACEVHTFGMMNLLGDSIHNFIDGLVIAASFSISIRLGVATSLAVALHEVPQELGDFGVLILAGWEKRKALFLNFLVALTVVLGGVVGYFLVLSEEVTLFLMPFAAGGFLYIASSDLMPEIRRETKKKKSILLFGFFLLGIGLMYLVRVLEF